MPGVRRRCSMREKINRQYFYQAIIFNANAGVTLCRDERQ
jgi:hypothetical protein